VYSLNIKTINIFLEIGSNDAAQADLQQVILLTLPSNCLNYRYAPPSLANQPFLILWLVSLWVAIISETQISSFLHSSNWANDFYFND
jgi:hypothetical protein